MKAVLSNGSVINKWEEPPCSDLPQLVTSIKNVKQFVNGYLTELVNKEKDSGDKSQKDVENSDEEDVEDTISGFIKEAALTNDPKVNNKRKVHTCAKLQEAKKKK